MKLAPFALLALVFASAAPAPAQSPAPDVPPGPARIEMLSCVSNFNFDWSVTYPYADDVAPLLPAGTIIHIISWHDNSKENKHNPNPDTWVGSGPTSIDEMSFAWVSLTYLEQKDFDQKVAERQAVVLSVAAAVVAMWDRTQVTAPVSAAAVKRPVTSVS